MILNLILNATLNLCYNNYYEERISTELSDWGTGMPLVSRSGAVSGCSREHRAELCSWEVKELQVYIENTHRNRSTIPKLA